MQTYPIPAQALDKAQQYAETAGSLSEALYNFLLHRPCGTVIPDDAAARAAYAQTLGRWYMDNSDLLSAGLAACRLLSDGIALLLEDTREAAESVPEPPSVVPDGANAAGYTSSLPRSSNAGKTAILPKSASLEEQRKFYQECSQLRTVAQTGPGGVRFHRPASTSQPMTPQQTERPHR